jgi:oleandomycin transport system ATP-binding protein
MSYAIQAEGLVKRFGKTTALAGVDLTARTGSVLGVLGPNGAGKTTAVRMLATLLKPDAGHATVGGFDVVRQAGKVRELIGLTGQYAAVDEELSGTENLILIGRLLNLSRPDARQRARDLLDRFHLTEAGGRSPKTYSGGMRRRLDLAASLVGRPEIMYLDEPTTGLDPRSRTEVWDMVRGLVADGVTVLLTTQYLDEADQLADEIAVIDHGRVIANGTSNDLKRKVGGQTLVVRPADRGRASEVARLVGDRTGLLTLEPSASGVISAPVNDPGVLTAVVGDLELAGIDVLELSLRLPSLDEVFFALTGHAAEDETADDAGNPRSAA